MSSDAFLSVIRPFRPPLALKGGHLQTVLPKIIKQAKLAYHRQLFWDSTGGTKIAYDFVCGDKDKPLLVLFTGLEGSSDSHYAIALAHQARQYAWNYVVVHYRGCGGIENTADIAYHAGDSAEVHHVLSILKQQYPTIYAAGVSLGGNMLAKYLGERQDSALCEKSALISTPFDLLASSYCMEKGMGKRVYIPYFLHTLRPKGRQLCQNDALKTHISRCRNLRQFDALLTAPMFGFDSVDDYYQKASSKPYLKNITKSTLVLNAQNDPFFPAQIMPKPEEFSSAITLLQPKEGGHAGFVEAFNRQGLMWLPETVMAFFQHGP